MEKETYNNLIKSYKSYLRQKLFESDTPPKRPPDTSDPEVDAPDGTYPAPAPAPTPDPEVVLRAANAAGQLEVVAGEAALERWYRYLDQRSKGDYDANGLNDTDEIDKYIAALDPRNKKNAITGKWELDRHAMTPVPTSAPTPAPPQTLQYYPKLSIRGRVSLPKESRPTPSVQPSVPK